MDPLEERMRRTLRDEHWRPTDSSVDGDDMLSRVYRGAARRRRRRTAVGATAAVAVLATGVGVGAGIVGQQPDRQVVAGPAETSESAAATDRRERDRAESAPQPSSPQPSSPQPSSPVPRLKTKQDTSPSAPSRSPRADTGRPVPRGFHALSMSAASTDTFWVLGGDRTSKDQAVVAKTRDSGANFDVAGRLKARAASTDNRRTPNTVAEIRFADGANGWAYGDGLWATHDGGRSWTRIASVPGAITTLEAAAGRAYALVEQDGATSLWTSDASDNSWHRVPVSLQDPADLAASRGQVVVSDRAADHTYVRVSRDGGESFVTRETPCTPTLEPGELSITKDALWLKCATGTAARVQVSDDHGRSWKVAETEHAIPANVSTLGARDAGRAVLGVPGGVVRVDTNEQGREVSIPDFGEPRFAGFTHPDLGYLMDDRGTLVRTRDGGQEWQRLSFR